jgi:hypothetical protein
LGPEPHVRRRAVEASRQLRAHGSAGPGRGSCSRPGRRSARPAGPAGPLIGPRPRPGRARRRRRIGQLGGAMAWAQRGKQVGTGAAAPAAGDAQVTVVASAQGRGGSITPGRRIGHGAERAVMRQVGGQRPGTQDLRIVPIGDRRRRKGRVVSPSKRRTCRRCVPPPVSFTSLAVAHAMRGTTAPPRAVGWPPSALSPPPAPSAPWRPP